MNNHEAITEIKRESFLSKEIAREEYWSQINRVLNQTRELQKLLQPDSAHIHISTNNMVLDYKLWNKQRIKLIIPQNDLRTASFTILANGNYESLLERTILELSELSKKFLDIGANMGFYAIGAALVNKEIKVLAFEPNPGIRKSLDENIRINEVEGNIQVLEFALSNFTGISNFSVPAFTGSGGGSLINLHPEEGSPSEFSVHVERLDNLSAATSGVDLIKIDVEGAEFQLVQGAIQTLKSSRATIVIELLRKWMSPFGSNPQDVLDLLSGMDYVCFAVGESSLQKVTMVDASTRETNFIFCHRENSRHLNLLKTVSGDLYC